MTMQLRGYQREGLRQLLALGDIAMVAVLTAVGIGCTGAWIAAGTACVKWAIWG